MLKIAILGDFIQTPEFKIDEKLLAILQDTDFNIANLEAPFITEKNKPVNGKFGLYQKIPDCSLLETLNIKIVSLANNHVSDFGIEGFRNTKEVLNKNNIHFFGAGETPEEAEKAAIYSCKGMEISCRGAMSRYLTHFHAGEQEFGTVDINADKMIETLKNDKADIKIVYNHWNQEYEDFPEPIYKEDAERIIQHSHVIAGSHSHCIQGIGNYKAGPVFYSLGNFSLPNCRYYNCEVSKYRPKSYHSFFPVLHITAESIKYEIIPFQLNSNGAVLNSVQADQTKAIKKRIKKISRPLELGKKDYLQFYKKHRDRKMRKPLTRSHQRNSMNLKMYRVKYKFISGLESKLANILDKLGWREKARRRFRYIIDKIHKAK